MAKRIWIVFCAFLFACAERETAGTVDLSEPLSALTTETVLFVPPEQCSVFGEQCFGRCFSRCQDQCKFVRGKSIACLQGCALDCHFECNTMVEPKCGACKSAPVARRECTMGGITVLVGCDSPVSTTPWQCGPCEHTLPAQYKECSCGGTTWQKFCPQ